MYDYEEEYDDSMDFERDGDELIDGVGFQDPESGSALRAATEDNPRIHPCPTCHAPCALTPIDVARGYQCDGCANAAERGWDRDYVCGGSENGCSLCAEHSEEESDDDLVPEDGEQE